jgi:hypothetical protein
MNAQVETLVHATRGFVGWWKASECKVKNRREPVKGYALMNGATVLGFIETTKPLARVEELLTGYTDPAGRFRTPRELMRELLNAEDYRSPIYDVIVRVYYAEDFA